MVLKISIKLLVPQLNAETFQKVSNLEQAVKAADSLINETFSYLKFSKEGAMLLALLGSAGGEVKIELLSEEGDSLSPEEAEYFFNKIRIHDM